MKSREIPRSRRSNSSFGTSTLFIWVLWRATAWCLFAGVSFGLQIAIPCSNRRSERLRASLAERPASANALVDTKKNENQFRYFEYDGYTISYRFQSASKGYEATAPLLLIHPIGIGLASWFWMRFLEDWKGSAVYAVNLLGCGQTEGSATVNIEEKGMFVPLTWVKQCESLIDTVILPEQENGLKTKSAGMFGRFSGTMKPSVPESGVIVMSQGGLAPVAILLAARNKCGCVKHMILSAPPADSEILSAVPENELRLNFNFLRGPLGQLAFRYALETEWAVRFFSNLFLFDKPCEDEWVETALQEAGPAVRIPVCFFNAGLCQQRSYEPELKDITVPCLILQGKADKRDRARYKEMIGEDLCQIVTISGQNVLPWESPAETTRALRSFLDAA